jgi:hypothetical protein
LSARIWLDGLYGLFLGVLGVVLFVVAIVAGARIGLWLAGLP